LDSYYNAGTFCALCLQPFQPTPAPVPTQLAGWMSNPTPVAHAAVSGGGAIGLGAPSMPGNTLFLFLLFSNSFMLVCRTKNE
jgi:hypothetical protein